MGEQLYLERFVCIDHEARRERFPNAARPGEHFEIAPKTAQRSIDRCTAHQVKITDVDITHLREKLGLSQDRFVALFGLSSRTVRNWEQGVRHPEGPARILFQVIDREPEAVMRTLRG
jgi:DNA-binding transcriptional regulator YiaG